MSNLHLAALVAFAVALVAGWLAGMATPYSEDRGVWAVYAAICGASALTFAAMAWWLR